MEELVYCYWDDAIPSVAEPPNEQTTALGASATTTTIRLCNEVLAPLGEYNYEAKNKG